jgi:hypothetical protein
MRQRDLKKGSDSVIYNALRWWNPDDTASAFGGIEDAIYYSVHDQVSVGTDATYPATAPICVTDTHCTTAKCPAESCLFLSSERRAYLQGGWGGPEYRAVLLQ